MATAPDVHVHDTELDADYYVSESRFRNPPKKGLWIRLDSENPRRPSHPRRRRSRPRPGHEADSKKETA